MVPDSWEIFSLISWVACSNTGRYENFLGPSTFCITCWRVYGSLSEFRSWNSRSLSSYFLWRNPWFLWTSSMFKEGMSIMMEEFPWLRNASVSAKRGFLSILVRSVLGTGLVIEDSTAFRSCEGNFHLIWLITGWYGSWFLKWLIAFGLYSCYQGAWKLSSYGF